ncbi:MAG TPA: sigma factor-like helix-turn-helix DNA-binding protein [Acidimicrobiales bacterium]|nr:sigma factor-like helix-turn-helix DNA-binding protein [Acidimicrobiales bacterium]
MLAVSAAPGLEVDAVAALSPPPFTDFYRRSRDQVGRALALTLGDAELAAEAVDEAMARAYARWSKIGAYENPGGWVYRVALNWATSVARRRRRQPHAPVDRDPTDVGPVAEPSVRAALEQLDVRHRAVIVCRYYLGLSEAETAAALGTRPGTVKSRLHRATRRLQIDLAHLDPSEQQ